MHELLSASLQQPQDKQVAAVWADVFGVSGSNDLQRAHGVIERLNWLYLEIRALASQVQASGLSPHLYESALARIETVTSPLHLPGQWQSYRGNLTPDVLLALAFLNEVLPDEEAAIDPSELAAINKQTDELEALLESSELPERLKHLVKHHLELIRTAIAQYPVRGAKALREAGRAALGEIIEAKDVVASQRGTEEVSRLESLWKRVNTAADVALKGERVSAWSACLGCTSELASVATNAT